MVRNTRVSHGGGERGDKLRCENARMELLKKTDHAEMGEVRSRQMKIMEGGEMVRSGKVNIDDLY